MDFLDIVKISFEKLREEVWELRKELIFLKQELNELKSERSSLNPQKVQQTLQIKTNLISSGNRGVPADRQTDTQTFDTPSFPVEDKPSTDFDTSTHNQTQTSTHRQQIPQKLRHFDTSLDTKIQKTPQIEDLTHLMEALKTDLKQKFKELTKQEFYIFSVLFTLDKTEKNVTYNNLATQTSLTSSSIRDYIQRIIQKGIPIIKEKLNNKLTVLKIPSELRNLATLDNLMRLRKDFKDQGLDNFTKN